MARKSKYEEINTPARKRGFLKEAIKSLHRRREIAQNPKLISVRYTESIGIRGLVISTMSRTQWETEDVEIKSQWVWELQKLGLAEIKPSDFLPDTQPREYYQVSLTDCSIEEAFKIIDKS
jgi:hypothetical protein